MLIIFGGLPGTGKTTIARELARQTGAMHLRIDSIEQAIMVLEAIPPQAKRSSRANKINASEVAQRPPASRNSPPPRIRN